MSKTVCSDFENLWISPLKWPTKFAIYPIKLKNEWEKAKELENSQLANENWLNVQSASRVHGNWNTKKKNFPEQMTKTCICTTRREAGF